MILDLNLGKPSILENSLKHIANGPSNSFISSNSLSSLYGLGYIVRIDF